MKLVRLGRDVCPVIVTPEPKFPPKWPPMPTTVGAQTSFGSVDPYVPFFNTQATTQPSAVTVHAVANGNDWSPVEEAKSAFTSALTASRFETRS